MVSQDGGRVIEAGGISCLRRPRPGTVITWRTTNDRAWP
jgi:hypothetical protein